MKDKTIYIMIVIGALIVINGILYGKHLHAKNVQDKAMEEYIIRQDRIDDSIQEAKMKINIIITEVK